MKVLHFGPLIWIPDVSMWYPFICYRRETYHKSRGPANQKTVIVPRRISHHHLLHAHFLHRSTRGCPARPPVSPFMIFIFIQRLCTYPLIDPFISWYYFTRNHSFWNTFICTGGSRCSSSSDPDLGGANKQVSSSNLWYGNRSKNNYIINWSFWYDPCREFATSRTWGCVIHRWLTIRI